MHLVQLVEEGLELGVSAGAGNVLGVAVDAKR